MRIFLIYFIAVTLMGCASPQVKHVGTIKFEANEVKFYSTQPMEMTAKQDGKEASFSTKKTSLVEDLMKLYGMKVIAGD